MNKMTWPVNTEGTQREKIYVGQSQSIAGLVSAITPKVLRLPIALLLGIGFLYSLVIPGNHVVTFFPYIPARWFYTIITLAFSWPLFALLNRKER